MEFLKTTVCSLLFCVFFMASLSVSLKMINVKIKKLILDNLVLNETFLNA